MTAGEVDRLSPARRPPGRPLGYQGWRDLLFLHWPLPPEDVRRSVPAPLSLDLHQGAAYLTIIPFSIIGSRPRWLPAACALDFLEINVRTYVHAGGRAGIYFFSLDAASRLAVLGGRLFFSLPYHLAHMRAGRQGEAVDYVSARRSRRGPRLRLRYRPEEALGPSLPGTLEHFLIERYLLFVEWGSSLASAQVHHPPYPVRRAAVLDLEEDLSAAAGLPAPPGLPPLAHYSPGVDVEIFALTRVADAPRGPDPPRGRQGGRPGAGAGSGP